MFTRWIMCLFQLRTVDFRLVFICQRAPVNLECFFSKRVYSTNIDCFDIDSSGLHLTFVAFYLFSDIRKQCLKQCNYSVDQSALLIGFRTDFTSSVWNLCRGVADVPPRETSPAAKSVEKRMFSQANNNRMPFCSVYFKFIEPEWLKKFLQQENANNKFENKSSWLVFWWKDKS